MGCLESLHRPEEQLFNSNKAQERFLTVVAPFALVDRILPEGELLQVGVGFGEQSGDEEAGPGGVQGGHGLGGRRGGMLWRIYYYYGQANDIHPDRLKIAAEFNDCRRVFARFHLKRPEYREPDDVALLVVEALVSADL